MITQEQKILQALKGHTGGLHPTYFISDLHIYQYNARINGIRKSFGCECKNGYRCTSREHIINKTLSDGTTLFFYKKTGDDVDWEKMRLDVIAEINAPITNLQPSLL